MTSGSMRSSSVAASSTAVASSLSIWHIADPAVLETIGDFYWFHLILPGWNCEPDCLLDVQFVRIGHFVLHTLPKKDVGGEQLEGLKVPDDTCIARMQHRRGVGGR
jgi:hypothetical protein